MRKGLIPAFEMSGHAFDALESMCLFYRLHPALVLRVIVESWLDAASEDGDLQSELAVAARHCRRTDHVPDCWLELEGDRFEEGPDDSGYEVDPNKQDESDKMRQSWANYGDDAAQWGERDDNAAFIRESMKARRSRFTTLGDAGETVEAARREDIGILAAAEPSGEEDENPGEKGGR
jgi:hypothetical protein